MFVSPFYFYRKNYCIIVNKYEKKYIFIKKWKCVSYISYNQLKLFLNAFCTLNRLSVVERKALWLVQYYKQFSGMRSGIDPSETEVGFFFWLVFDCACKDFCFELFWPVKKFCNFLNTFCLVFFSLIFFYLFFFSRTFHFLVFYFLFLFGLGRH